MVKRPMVYLSAGYLLGICIGRSRPALFLPVFLLCVLILLLKKIIQTDPILCLIPLLFAAGVFRIQQAEAMTPLEAVLEEKKECVLTGTVKEAAAGSGYVKLIVTDTTVWLKEMELAKAGDVQVYASVGALCAPGSQVRLTGSVQPLGRGENPGQYDEYDYAKAKGIGARMQAEQVKVTGTKGYVLTRQLWKLKQRLRLVYETILPEKEAGVLEAMLLAEKGNLAEETRKDYQKAGISHILAVSGLHFTMLGMLLFRLLKRLGAGVLPATGAAVALVLLYGIFTGFGISVTRAVVMLVLSFLSSVAGKTYDAPSALSFAALLILLEQPLQLFQAGFLMSFGAVTGILLLAPVFQAMGVKMLSGSLAVQLMLTPILLWFYYEVPVYSLVLNLLILPFMSLVLVSGLAAGVVGCVHLGMGKFLAGTTYFLLRGYELVCKANDALPFSTWLTGRPQVWQMVLFYAGLLICYLCSRKWAMRAAGKQTAQVEKPAGKRLLLGFCALLLVFAIRDRQLTVTYLSVGQGDCAVIEQGSMTVVMDAGSSKKNGADKILAPYLSYQGDRTIEYLVLSHTDSDHYSMLKEVLEAMAAGEAEITIETLVMPLAGSAEESYQMLIKLAEAAGVSVVCLSAGDRIAFDDMTLRCVYPDSSLGAYVTDTNEMSLVLSLETKQSIFLFPGDASSEGEKAALDDLCEEVLAREERRRYLKAAHHGSRYSNCEEMLELFFHGTAILSCGENNSYGHPHRETLARMADCGIKTYITWQSGAVRVYEKTGRIIQWNESAFH